jgi:hypothetical protein
MTVQPRPDATPPQPCRKPVPSNALPAFRVAAAALLCLAGIACANLWLRPLSTPNPSALEELLYGRHALGFQRTIIYLIGLNFTSILAFCLAGYVFRRSKGKQGRVLMHVACAIFLLTSASQFRRIYPPSNLPPPSLSAPSEPAPAK